MEKDSLQLLKIKHSPLIEWVDTELSDNYRLHYQNNEASDTLLELRMLLSSNIESLDIKCFLGQFYRILPTLEKHYYLLGYRMRQWLSLSYGFVLVDPLERVPALPMSLQLGFKSISEAKKIFFEHAQYEVPYHDIRVEVRAH